MIKNLITSLLTLWSLLGGCPYSNNNCENCDSFRYKIKKIGELPGEIKESSGLAKIGDLFITHGDSQTDPVIYGFKYPFNTDTVTGRIAIPNALNKDWEELTMDENHNIYIGDFGNNSNSRSDLRIISYNYKSHQTETFPISYKDQDEFPPKRLKSMNFDCEAMFWHEGSIFLFSKNKVSKNTKVYRFQEQFLNIQLVPYDTIDIRKSHITSADIRPDKSEIALLSYGKVLFFKVQKDDNGDIIFTPKSCKRFGRSGQAEAIIYLDNENLLITNEKGKIFLLYRKYKNAARKELKSPEAILTEILSGDLRQEPEIE